MSTPSAQGTQTPSLLSVPQPSFPKGGGSLHGLDGLVPNVDMNGGVQLTIPLPISPARYLTPTLTLQYQSSQGNSPFGLGFALNLLCIRRRTNKGVPLYQSDDVFIGSDGEYLVPATQAEPRQQQHHGIRYKSTRFYSRRESQFNYLEYWQAENATSSYWTLQEANGTQHLFGFSAQARISDPMDSSRIFSWLLEESWGVQGEHCVYEYKAEDTEGIAVDNSVEHARKHNAQRYLKKISYANCESATDGYILYNPAKKKHPLAAGTGF
jgi:insecticidal toxin complex protein TccC